MVDKFGKDDWFLGWRSAVGTSGEGFALSAVMSDSTGVPLGTPGNPLATSSAASAPAVISATNSSTTPLALSGVFTGTSTSTLAYGAIVVNAFSNVASAVDGLSVQQSSDGTNWDIIDVYTVAASTSIKLVVPRQAAFVRVLYTNGGTLQTTFRLQTILAPQMPIASSFRPADAMTNENDMPEGLSFGMIWTGTTWNRRKATPYQTNQIPIIGGSGNVANASAAATLTGTATTTVYLAGFEITGAGATVGLPVTVTVAGLLGGTRSYTYVFAVGALVSNQPLNVQFNPPLPAAAVNTPIVVTCPASGAGGTNNTAVAHGYYL